MDLNGSSGQAYVSSGPHLFGETKATHLLAHFELHSDDGPAAIRTFRMREWQRRGAHLELQLSLAKKLPRQSRPREMQPYRERRQRLDGIPQMHQKQERL